MLINTRSLTAAVTMAVVLAVLVSLGQTSPADASGLLQGSSDPPEIAEPECSFWLDHDNDREGDEPFNTEPDFLVLQQSPVVGGCSFKLTSPDEATILVGSELSDWELEVEMKREPGTTDDFKMYPGRTEILGIQGSMRVIVNFAKGSTPLSGKTRTLPDNYRHEVQIPEEFRLLEITVTTPDGPSDRLEKNATSASGAYINAQRLISQRKDEMPRWVVSLSEDWLEEGYPQAADRLITANVGSVGSGSTNWWKWIAIVTWVGVVVVSIFVVVLIVLNARREQTQTLRNPIDPF